MTSRLLPSAGELLDGAVVVSLPMRVRFRSITAREVLLLRGPAGWGEFGPFPEYGDEEAAYWLQSAIEAAWQGYPPARRDRVAVNATVPAVGPEQVPEVLARFPGASTAKVKVAEPGQELAQDLARVRAVREHLPNVRIDANGGWTVEEAVRALTALTADAPLEYAEQPCATVPELVEVRRRLPRVRIAADESIRRVEDPMRVVRAGGADVAVVKVAPLGGVRRLVALADELAGHSVEVVVSSALDSAVGIATGLAAAAALPALPYACGLGTGGFFEADVAPSLRMSEGALDLVTVAPEPDMLDAVRAAPDRTEWWYERLRRCRTVLAGRGL